MEKPQMLFHEKILSKFWFGIADHELLAILFGLHRQYKLCFKQNGVNGHQIATLFSPEQNHVSSLHTHSIKILNVHVTAATAQLTPQPVWEFVIAFRSVRDDTWHHCLPQRYAIQRGYHMLRKLAYQLYCFLGKHFSSISTIVFIKYEITLALETCWNCRIKFVQHVSKVVPSYGPPSILRVWESYWWRCHE